MTQTGNDRSQWSAWKGNDCCKAWVQMLGGVILVQPICVEAPEPRVTESRPMMIGQLDPVRTRPNALALMFMATIVAAAALPMFFDAYRSAFYSTVSYDDYSRYLLWFLGQPGAALPPSPHVYRLGSVVLAAPFYYLPLVQFSGEGIYQAPVGRSVEYAKALQAMCVANAVYASISACVAGLFLALRRDVAPGWAFAAALAFMLLTPYFGMASADGIALLPVLIAVIGMVERRMSIFAPAVILGAIVNEKVALVVFFALGLRAIFVTEHRKTYLAMAIVAAAALAAYAATVFTLAMPGLDNQRNPATYLSAIASSIHNLTGAKGVYQNIWPVILLLVLWWTSIRHTGRDRIVYPCDVGVILALFAFAMALDVQYNVGRIVMFSIPLFFLGAVESIGRLYRDGHSDSREAAPVEHAPFRPQAAHASPVVRTGSPKYPQAAC